ncbi:hypothetical protein OS190_18645 [Sulfitobacter sp. F26204]|uniref:hypothetical protein n=1 Tax=Sulfitobacter sp. F26204 TaxID=2996014 RepID=UPI00225DEFE7|nr:hypothetical protein [Sulfitobacter sp. F26204]MCX7561585.1 hypothetical protein [Sulfitobacter sp. F26204]
MAQNLDHGYSAKISTRGVVWSLRVNDLFVRENVDVPYATSIGDIGVEMQPGRNTLSLDFSPVTGRDPATGKYVYALRDGVKISIVLERRDYASQQSIEIHPVDLEYSDEKKSFVPVAPKPDAPERVLQNGALQSTGQYRITEISDRPMVLKSGQEIGGYRLELEFQVDDEALPAFHWAGNAVALTDGPELRESLLNAYQNLHGLISKGDAETIFRMAEPVWARTAAILTSEPSARAFIEHSDFGLADRYSAVRSDGAVLQPLGFWGDHQEAAIQFMADQRLVRFRPDPIFWETPPAGSGNRTSFPVVFYQTGDGSWHLGLIAIGM